MTRKLAVLLAALILVIGMTPAAAQDDTAQAHKEVVRSVLAELSSGNFDALAQLFPEQYKMNQGGTTLDTTARADTQAFLGAIRGAIPDLQITPSFVLAQGDEVAAELVFSGTSSQPFDFPAISSTPTPPTHQSVMWSEMDFFHFDDAGMVDQQWSLGDPTVMLTQLGVFPSQGDDVPGTPLDVPAGYQALSADELAATFVSGMEERNTTAFKNQLELGITHLVDNHIDPFVSWSNGKPYSVTAAQSQETSGFFQVLAQAMPDVSITPDTVVAEGDWVAGVAVFKGTFTQDANIFGTAVIHTDKPIAWAMGFAARLNADGQIVEDWSEGDLSPLLQGLGVMPAPGAQRQQ